MTLSKRDLLLKTLAESACDSELCIACSAAEELNGYSETNVIVSDGKIQINDLATKSKLIAEHHYNLLEKGDELSFFKKAEKLLSSTRKNEDLTVVENFVFLGSRYIDIFSSAKAYILDEGDIFLIFQILEKGMNLNFPYNPQNFVDFFILAYGKVKNDLMTNYYIKKLCDFIFNDEEVCKKIHSAYKGTRNELLIPIYNNIVIKFFKKNSWMKENIIDEVKHNPDTNHNSIYLLGRILLEEGIHFGEEIRLLTECSTSNSEEQRSFAFNALALHLGLSDDVDAAFKQALTQKNTQAILAIAYKLSSDWSNFISHPDFSLWLGSLAYIPPGLTGAEDWRDDIFSQNISSQYSLISSSLEKCFLFYKKQNATFEIEKIFSSTLHEFVKINFFPTQLLLWLNSKEFPMLAIDIIRFSSVHKIQYPEFELDKFNITNPDNLLFLCRRILGYAYEVDFLLHALFSMARLYKETTLLDIIFQSIDIVAFDYPSQTEQAAKKLHDEFPDTDLAEMIKALLTKMNNYFKALHTLPWIGELCPTQSEEMLFQKERHKSISQEIQVAHKQSILGELVSSVPIKAGKAFFSYRDGFPDASVPFVSLESTLSLPRSLLIDPVQYELQRFRFRLQTRSEE